MPMMFRSPLTRYFLAGIGALTGLIFLFGDPAKWRTTPSLVWLAQTGIPLEFWGILTLVYSVLLLLPWTRAAGYAIGAFLYSVFAVSILATVRGPEPSNIYGLAGLTITVVFHIYSIRTAESLRLLKKEQATGKAGA